MNKAGNAVTSIEERKNPRAAVVGLVLLAVVLCATSSLRAAVSSLSLQIGGPVYQQTGTDIPVTITLLNTSDQAMVISRTDFVGNNADLDVVFRVTSYKGAPIGETDLGLYLDGQGPAPTSQSRRSATLPAGGQLQETERLNTIYSLGTPGFYLVQVIGLRSGAAVQPSNTLPLIVTSGAGAPIPGDLTGDGIVDLDDLAVIQAALNTTALGTGDPRDLNHDGVINIQDARILTTLCTYPRCVSQP